MRTCGAGGHDHHTSACKNAPKCNQCEVWIKEKEISKIKITKTVPYLKAKQIFENQTPELDFTKIVTSLSAKPESKTIRTQFFESDFTINPSSKVISPSVKQKFQPKPTSVSQSHSNTQSQSNSRSPSGPSRSHSQSASQSSSQSQSGSQSSSQSSSQTSSQKKEKKNQSMSGQGSGRRSFWQRVILWKTWKRI